MFLLNINRKPCMGSPMAPSHVTLRDLERSESRSLRFQSLVCRKRTALGPMLLLIINRKPYAASPMTPAVLTLSVLKWSKSRSVLILSGRRLHGIDVLVFASSSITTLIWMSQKVVCWRAGFSAVPAVFLFF